MFKLFPSFYCMVAIKGATNNFTLKESRFDQSLYMPRKKTGVGVVDI